MKKEISNNPTPWFYLITSGKKTSEGRLLKNDWLNVKIGDKITFFNKNDPLQEVDIVVKQLTFFNNFKEAFIFHGSNLVPFTTDYLVVEKLYREFFSDELVKKYKIVVISW